MNVLYMTSNDAQIWLKINGTYITGFSALISNVSVDEKTQHSYHQVSKPRDSV